MAKKPQSFWRRLSNVDFSFGPGRTLTAGKGGKAGMTAAFTPATTAKEPTPARVKSGAIQTAGQLSPQPDKVTPEQTFDQSLHPSPDPTAASVDAPATTPPKTDPVVTASRVQQYLLARFNPIRGLTPQLLSTYLEQSDLGFLRYMALVWNKIRERDDQIGAVAVKRELRPIDMQWEIVQVEDMPEGEAHKKALEAFYENLSCTHALEQNTRGGVGLLIRQMMRAVGDKFSVHEIVWRPNPDGLTAEFRWIPVWFFENRTGQLRFLPYELALQGIPLEPGGWCVHVAEGLFQATSIAYLIKQMGLKYWASYAEKFGIPFLHGETNAQFGSQEWDQFLTALKSFSSDGSMLTSAGGKITPIAAGGAAEMPQPALVDRMDRAIARIWAGGDLSTMSRGAGHGVSGSGGVGSNPQMDNESTLAKADAVRITETLQFYVDTWVIKYLFGDNVTPAAHFVLSPPRSVDSDREIAVDTFLMGCGVPTSINDLLERYGRATPESGEPLATAPAPKPSFGGAGGAAGSEGDSNAMGNVAANGFKRYQVTSRDLVARAQADAIAPVRDRLGEIAKLAAPERTAALKKLRDDLPRMLKRVAGSPELTKALEDAMGSAVIIGATDAAAKNGTHINGKQHRMTEHFTR